MFFYLAKRAQNSAQVTAAFIQKGISGLTQAKMSELPYMARANQHQLAFDGYKANIDTFLYATATKEKIYTTATEAGIPASFEPKIPLRLPGVYFQFKRDPNEQSKAAMMEKYAVYGIKELTFGKAIIYTMSNPNITILKEKLIPVIKESCTPVSSYISVQAYISAFTCLCIIDLFLATNTYPYSRTLEPSAEFEQGEGIGHVAQYQTKLTRGVRIGSAPGPAKKKTRSSSVIPEGSVAPAQDMEIDEPDYAHYDIPVYSETLTAKPSTVPSSINFGAPKDVPFLPGLAFPYFHTMLAGDIRGFRSTVIQLFARNLPVTVGETTRAAIKRFQSDIAGFVFTSEGLVMAHIFLGIQMALESQTQLFLVMDASNYLGFVLLGGCWSFFDGVKWCMPVEAEALKITLSSWVTHHISLDSMAGYLSSCENLQGGVQTITAKDIDTSLKLARVIGNTRLSGENGKEIEKKLISNLKYLTFGNKFKAVTKENVQWLLEMLTTKADEEFPENMEVYLPRSNLSLLSKRSMIAFSAFGPLAPNFFAATGTEYKVPEPKSDKTDTFLTDKTDKGGLLNQVIVIPLAPPDRCVGSWETVISKKAVRFEPNERSKESRCCVFKGDSKTSLWEIYKSTIGTIIKEKPEVDGKGKQKESNAVLGVGALAGSIDTYDW